MRNLIAACVAITVFGFAFGMTYPLLSLILESQGVSTRMIGINAAMTPVGILLFSSVIPVATKTFGARKLAIVASLLSAIVIVCYKLFPSLEAWFVLRVLQGMTTSVLFVLSEAWIVGYTSDNNRGRVVAIYASVLSFSFAMGPALVSVTGIDGWIPFILGPLVIILGTVPLFFIQEDKESVPEESVTSSLISFIPKAPLLVLAVGAFAVFDAATLSLLPIFAIRHGLGIADSTLLLTALIVGNVALQYPIGSFADRYPRIKVLGACTLVTAIMLFVLPWVMGSWIMWFAVVVAGAAGYGVYTVALTSLGDRFSGQELIDGTAVFASVWGLGALVGATMGGWAMEGFGVNGLPLSLSIMFFALLFSLRFGGGTLVRAQ